MVTGSRRKNGKNGEYLSERLGLVGDTDIMSFMSPRYFLTYSFQWRIPLVILRYMAHLDSSNKLFFILKKTIEKTALVTQNHHF